MFQTGICKGEEGYGHATPADGAVGLSPDYSLGVSTQTMTDVLRRKSGAEGGDLCRDTSGREGGVRWRGRPDVRARSGSVDGAGAFQGREEGGPSPAKAGRQGQGFRCPLNV